MDANTTRSGAGLFVCASVLVSLLALAAIWSSGPLSGRLDVAAASFWLDSVKDRPLTPLILLAVYVLGSIVMVPITLLILATAFAYGPLLGFVYALLGCVSGAAVTYLIGYLLGYDAVRRLGGKWASRVAETAARHGFVAVFTTHLIPVAPFAIVNMIAGASGIRFGDFMAGAALGMAPGIALIAIFEQQLESAIRDPGSGAFVVLAAVTVLAMLGTVWVRRRLWRSAGGSLS